MTLTHIDLFSGIGGMSLAADWAGFRTVLFCERDAYCRRVLAKHWPHVPCAPDIHTLTGDIVRAHLAFDYTPDAADTDSERWWQREYASGRQAAQETALAREARIDLLTGGFPCQPFSVAGKQRGKDDDRHLWPEMLRCIQEVRPTWVCGENVNGFIAMALDDVCADLEAAGYEVQPVVLPACGVGAWHRRERVFIIAHDVHDAPRQPFEHLCGDGRNASGAGEGRRSAVACAGRADVPDAEGGQDDERERGIVAGEAAGGWGGNAAAFVGRQDVPDGEGERRQRDGAARHGWPGPADGGGWLEWDGQRPLESIWDREPQSPICRMADGLSPGMDEYRGRVAGGAKNRVSRLRALGNAVVPSQVYPILAAIAEQLRGAACSP